MSIIKMRAAVGLLLGVLAVVANAGEIEDACRDLIMDYAVHRDAFNADAYADLFTEDAVLTVLGKEYRGRDAIRERLLATAGTETIRHLVGTVRITVNDDSSATGISYVSVYTSEPGELPLKSNSPVVGEYHDEFSLTAEGWKISRRTFVPVFVN